MKRIIFINPHLNEFLCKTLFNYVFSQSSSRKHLYLINYMREHKIPMYFYVNELGISFFKSEKGRFAKLLRLFRYIEYKIIMYLNGLSDIKMIKNMSDIKKDDIVIGYIHWPDELYKGHKMKATKVLCMMHYYGKKMETDLVKQFAPDMFFSEADLGKLSRIFKREFSDITIPYMLLPFTYQQRFISQVNFKERKNKAVAMGTVTVCNDPNFIMTYGDNCYQPLRRQILDSKETLNDIIDCYISPYNENGNYKIIDSNDNILLKMYKTWCNLNLGKQKKYFSFDMVKKYNQYKICIVPEDINGMPGIGFVEGMACGCAYIGLNYEAYKDLGLIEGIHFIGYDGTLKDLREKISYWLAPKQSKKLEEIAENGMKFVRENFKEEIVAKNFIDSLREIKDKSDDDI